MILLAMACAVEDRTISCEKAESSTEDVAPPLTEAELWAVLAEFSPAEVVWEVAASGDDSSHFALSIDRGEGVAATVEYAESDLASCPKGTYLRVPAVLDIDVADGNALAELTGNIVASSASPADVSFADFEGTATVGAEWADAASTWPEVEGEIGEWVAGLDETLESPEFHITGGWDTEESQGSALLWRGVVMEP